MRCRDVAEALSSNWSVRVAEPAHGRVPTDAIVFLKTGWGQHWKNPTRYRNQDSTGRMHFPGFSVEAARFLIEQRKMKALGIDTLSIDYGPSKDFAVHHLVNGAGRYAIENVAQLDKLPARDFFVFVAPVKIESGSGGPLTAKTAPFAKHCKTTSYGISVFRIFPKVNENVPQSQRINAKNCTGTRV